AAHRHRRLTAGVPAQPEFLECSTSVPAWIASAIGTRARVRDPDPPHGCLVVLIMKPRMDRDRPGDLPVVKIQAPREISPSKVMPSSRPSARHAGNSGGRTGPLHVRPLWLIVAFRFHQHLHCLVDREAARLLPRWELLEGLDVLRDDRLRRYQDEQVLDEPSVVIAGLLFRTLERV